MSITFPTVQLFLPSDAGEAFTLDDAAWGVLDSDTLGGGPGADGVANDITSYSYDVSISRGRSRDLDEFNVGLCSVKLRNHSRTFDPIFAADEFYVLLESGDYLLLEVGDQIILENSGGTGLATDVRPGKRLRILDNAATCVFDGIIEDWNYRWLPGGYAEAEIVAVDLLGKLGRQRFLEWTTVDAQRAGARIHDSLDRSEVNFPLDKRDIDDGVSTLTTDSVTYGSNVLNYLQLVAKSDVGRLFASRTGTLTFRDRHNYATGAAVAAFGDSGAAIRFSSIEVTFGTELLFTDVAIDREGGTLQRATAADSVITEFGYRPWPDTTPLLLDSDEQSYQMANYLLGRHKEPEAVVTGLTVMLDSLTTGNRATVAALEIGDIITVTWTPTGSGGQVAQTLVVEGVRYVAALEGGVAMVLSMSNASDRFGLVLDSSELGVLDTSLVGF